MKLFIKLVAAKGRNSLREVLALIVIINLIITPVLNPVGAAGTDCAASSPVSGLYTITICITAPGDGAVVGGEASVTATVSVTGTNPGVQKLIFYLGGQYLLTDYAPSYTFVIPTTKFVDGSRLLEAEATMRDGFISARAAISVTFSNGVTQPPVNTNSYTPSSGSTPQTGRPFVLAATGDGAGGEPNADAVTDLIASWNPNMLLYLGDVYNDGTSTEFHNWYGTGTGRYSRFRAITNPTVGNHEYQGLQAPGYFDYWDNVPHYYSFNAAGWHVISLDSTSQYNQTLPGTPQYNWLLDDLTADSATCTIAYFHHPLYNVGAEGESTRMSDIWALLAQHGVDIVLTGHDHDYQRWYALNGQGVLDPNGITQFVVGAGGHGIQDFIKTDSRMAMGFDTPPAAFGALRMELNQDGAVYQYVNIQGAVLDSGSLPCSGAAPDIASPNAPTNLTATALGSTHVDLNWTSAIDNIGVTSYEIYRNGALLDTVGMTASYADNTVVGSVSYQYQVRALDAAGNISGLSNLATVTAPLLFSDEFETGNLSNWTNVTGLTVQQQEMYDGAYGARGTSTGAATWAYKQLGASQNNVYYRLHFKIISLASNVYLLRFRTSSGTSLLGVYVSSTGKLAYRNDITGVATTSTTNVTNGVWHDLQVRVFINGAAGQTEVWFDGTRIDVLSKTESLSSTPVRRIQVGDNSTGRTYDVAFDNVTVNTSFIDMTMPTIAISEPIENAVVKAEVTLGAVVTDGSAIDRVEFFANGTLIGTDYTAPYNMIWNSTTGSDGPATLTARVVDIGLNSTTSTGRVVIVDNTPPGTTIDSGPSGIVNSNAATFTFSSNETASYICRIDDVEIEGCISPRSFNNLFDGLHTFEVVATDIAGNTDPTPASHVWTVDTGAPTATATLVPSNTPTFTPTPTLGVTPTATATLVPTNTSTSTVTFTSTPTGTVTLFTFTPTLDAYVNEASSATNFGTATTLRADASPIVRSYLRFNVQGLSGTVTRATLRVFTNSASSAGYEVRNVTDNTWGELTINFINAPAVGSVTGTSGPFSLNTWTSVDITSLVAGNGTRNFALTTTTSTAFSLASRESGTNAPQLVIETQSGATATVTPTSVPANTPTFTPTPTLGFTPTATATFVPTNTPASSPTFTPSPTLVFTPTATPTLVPTNTPTSTPGGGVSTFTFTPTADAYVNEASVATNFGTATTLRADASPIVRSYLRFNVQGLSGAVTRATLRVFSNSASSTGYEVRNVTDNTWGELTINFTNAPAVGGVSGTSGAFATGAWTTVDITPLVIGNGAHNLALTTTTSTAFSLASRESVANAPQLVIETLP